MVVTRIAQKNKSTLHTYETSSGKNVRFQNDVLDIPGKNVVILFERSCQQPVQIEEVTDHDTIDAVVHHS